MRIFPNVAATVGNTPMRIPGVSTTSAPRYRSSATRSFDMGDAVARARQLVQDIPDAIMLDQFSNPANPDVHRRTTAMEIWRDTRAILDEVIAIGDEDAFQTARRLARDETLWPVSPQVQPSGRLWTWPADRIPTRASATSQPHCSPEPCPRYPHAPHEGTKVPD